MTTSAIPRYSGVQPTPDVTTGRIQTWIRVVSLAPLGLFLALITLLALSLTGWHLSGMSTTEQLRSDAGSLCWLRRRG